MTSQPQQFTVKSDEAGQRLDIWLTRLLPDLSRSRIQALIQAGHITREGQPVKEHRKIHTGERFTVVIPPPVDTAVVAEPIPLNILYEDTDLIVLNKPDGLVTHPAAGHLSGTLVNALLHHCTDLGSIGGEKRPGIVHRLDRDTSGVLVAAKNERSLNQLVNQFKDRKVRKEYLALVWGCPHPAQGTIQTLIGRHTRDRKKMSATPKRGRPAVTVYETMEVFPEIALIRLRPETGRTHQIRVHLAHIGHAVVGDTHYGSRTVKHLPAPVHRQLLHAAALTFDHPTTGKRLTFTAPMPADMAALLAVLRQESGRAKTTTFPLP